MKALFHYSNFFWEYCKQEKVAVETLSALLGKGHFDSHTSHRQFSQKISPISSLFPLGAKYTKIPLEILASFELQFQHKIHCSRDPCELKQML